MDHTGQENIWFVGCLTTPRATPASREGVPLFKRVSTTNGDYDTFDTKI